METDRKAIVSSFMEVTGVDDESFAEDMLRNHNWSLEDGVHAYMMLVGDDGFGGIHSVPGTGGSRSSPVVVEAERPEGNGESRMEVERERVTRGAAGAGSETVERLVENMPEVMGPVIENFRKFSSEGMQVPVSGKEDDEGSYLFPPPAKLMFQGNFDKLREKAEGEEKYCLVNLQKRDIFHSQMLNRDTWSNELVTAVVTSKFIFWQQEFESTAGRQYLSIYPSYTFPVIDIIDPLTGALLERIEEYIAPKDLVERLSRFLDSHQWGKMGKALQVASSSALSAPQPSIPSVKGPGNMETKSRMSLEDEDAELHAAIEASLQDNPAFPPDGCLDDDGDRGRSENIYSHYTDSLRVAQDIEFQKSLEEDRRKEQARLEEQRRIERIKREAEEAERQRERQLEDVRNSLPPEPSKEDRSATHIQLRFPDGSRHSRRFLDTETLKVVLDFMFVCGADPEKHTLATAFPRKILDEADKSLKDLGLSHHISLNVEKK